MNALEIKNLLLNSGVCRSPSAMKGMSEAEIAEQEKRFGVAFPRQYREMLLAIGLDASGFFVGTDLFSPTLNEWARDILEDDTTTQMPANSWVFSMHQGYQFDSFACDGRDDPPVHKYLEGKGWTFEQWPSLSRWIIQGVEWHLQFK